MKKAISCFFVASAIVTVQLFPQTVVKAETVLGYDISAVSSTKVNHQEAIPMLAKLQQVSSNQLEISYDRDVDVKLGTKASNYWVQDTVNAMPKGIATLGKNSRVNNGNSLNDNLVIIQSKDGSAKTFILTFKQDIPKGAKYKLIICYVTVPGAPPYNGDNGTAEFVGK